MSSPSALSLVIESWLRRGVVDTVRHLAEEQSFDRVHGVRTTGRVPVERLVKRVESAWPDTSEYQPVPAALFRAALAAVPAAARAGAFVDLGCGKGRALVMAAEAGFRHVRGVELARPLACQAELNAEAVASRLGVTLEWRLEVADAAERAFDPDETCVFLFNPFGRLVLRRVLDRLSRSLAAHPRAAAVIYVNPQHLEVLAESRALTEHSLGKTRIGGVLDWAVYVSRCTGEMGLGRR
ncbi:MAG: class I SAM-dependent methyltransferase [Deltaproteobacteria bacterium]|nr:class I SAM-dependent methyltransferase [Deltaproteobacteria bacterium]